MSTLSNDYFLFAKNEDEREIWLQSLAKILEFNTKGESLFNLRTPADMSTSQKKKTIQFQAEGTDLYKSQDL